MMGEVCHLPHDSQENSLTSPSVFTQISVAPFVMFIKMFVLTPAPYVLNLFLRSFFVYLEFNQTPPPSFSFTNMQYVHHAHNFLDNINLSPLYQVNIVLLKVKCFEVCKIKVYFLPAPEATPSWSSAARCLSISQQSIKQPSLSNFPTSMDSKKT